MNEEDANPLMALLAHQLEPTELDKHFGKKENKKERASESSGPIVVVDESDDNDDTPIGLTHRQPSFSSLHGPLILKDGEAIPNLPQVTEDVQETSNESGSLPQADVSPPSGLRRQSSYATLLAQVPVPKQDNHPSTIKPIAENKPKYTENLEEEDEEEDYDPQVIIVKQLKDKNKERWHELGYQPPKNLVSIVRTASQASYTLSQTSASSTPMASYGNEQNPLPVIEDIHEEQKQSDEDQGEIQKVTKIRRARCGSDGMKLGEASSSMALMESIICENPSTIEIPIDQVDEPEEDYIPASEPSSSDSGEFLDRIVGLVENGDELTARAIMTGKLPHKNDSKKVTPKLEKVAEKCNSLGWNIEADYINGLIIDLCESSVRISVAAIYDQRDIEIENLSKKLEQSLAIINSEYAEAAEKLDKEWHSQEKLLQFSKPSSNLLNLRASIKLAEKQKLPKIKLDRIRDELACLTEQETLESTKKLRDAYFAADAALKAKYAERKATAYSRYHDQISIIEQRADDQASKLNYKNRK